MFAVCKSSCWLFYQQDIFSTNILIFTIRAWNPFVQYLTCGLPQGQSSRQQGGSSISSQSPLNYLNISRNRVGVPMKLRSRTPVLSVKRSSANSCGNHNFHTFSSWRTQFTNIVTFPPLHLPLHFKVLPLALIRLLHSVRLLQQVVSITSNSMQRSSKLIMAEMWEAWVLIWGSELHHKPWKAGKGLVLKYPFSAKLSLICTCLLLIKRRRYHEHQRCQTPNNKWSSSRIPPPTILQTATW